MGTIYFVLVPPDRTFHRSFQNFHSVAPNRGLPCVVVKVHQHRFSAKPNMPVPRSQEVLTGAGPELMQTGSSSRQTERRRRIRVPLKCAIYLSRIGDTHPLQSKTANLSCDGFYCNVDEPFTPGERLDCDIVMPAWQAPADSFVIHCRAQVLRLERRGTGPEYGIACRIEDYSIKHWDS